MRVIRGGLSIFVSSWFFMILIAPPAWPHGFHGGAGVVIGRGGPAVFVPFPMGAFGPVIIAGGAMGAGVGHRGYPVYPWGYYPVIPPPESSYPSPSPYDFEIKSAGRLRVSVQPQDAEVFVDGMRLEPVGSPAFDLGLLVGSHTVQVAKEGYQTYTSEVSIETAKTAALSVELEGQ